MWSKLCLLMMMRAFGQFSFEMFMWSVMFFVDWHFVKVVKIVSILEGHVVKAVQTAEL